MKKFLPLSVALVALLLLATCEREWSNPFDPNNTLDPKAWAPQNLQIETTSITQRQLTWTYNGPATIQGFKIDRKKGDEAWQVAMAALPKEDRTWNDTTLIPQAGLTYQYRIYTYAGNNSSADKTTTTQADFPAPSDLTITKLSDISYKLEWKDNSTGEQGFKIDRRAIENEWVIGYGSVGANETAFVDTNVFVGKSSFNVEYRVYAFYNETESAKIDANTIAALTPPTDLTITQNTISSVTLNWQDNSAGEEGFKIERKYETGDWIELTTITGTSWQDNNYELNTMVYYRVFAYVGNYSSVYAENNFDATMHPPTNLQITKNTITLVTLTWQDNSTGEQGFKIERKYETGDWVEVATTIGTSWQDNDFELNKMVYYRVKAYYNKYTSAWLENSFNATIPPPEDLAITANSATSVALNWNYSLTGHEGFKIERKIDNESWVMLVGNLNPGQRNFTDSDIDMNSHNYHYRINAFLGQFVSQQIDFPEIPFLCVILNIIDSRDGNQYQTVQIGNQCWMKENLKWLPSVSPSANGSNTTAYYYVYDYQGTSVSAAKATTNYQTYGVLYNWPAALNGCPAGWNLPTDNEWTVLINYLGGSSVAGGKMKTTGTTHWSSPNTGATNSSGFSGLPGGTRVRGGYFNDLGLLGLWWSSTEGFSTDAWYRLLYYGDANAGRSYYSKEFGFSVRCVRD